MKKPHIILRDINRYTLLKRTLMALATLSAVFAYGTDTPSAYTGSLALVFAAAVAHRRRASLNQDHVTARFVVPMQRRKERALAQP